MNIREKTLQIQQLAMDISEANIAIATTDYFGSTQNLMVIVNPVGAFDTHPPVAQAILREDIDLKPTQWITEEAIHQQLDHTIHQLQLIKSPAQSNTGEALERVA